MNSYTLFLDNDFLVDVKRGIEEAVCDGDMSSVEYGHNLDPSHHDEFSVTVDGREKIALDQAVFGAGIRRVDIVCEDTTGAWRDDIVEGAGQIVEFLLVISQEPTHLCGFNPSYLAMHLGWGTTKYLGAEGESDEKFVMVKEQRESLYDTIEIGFSESNQGGDYYGATITTRESIPVYFRPEAADDDLNEKGQLNSNAPWFWSIVEEFNGGSFDSEGLMKRSGFILGD